MARFLLTVLAAVLYALGWLWGVAVSAVLWVWVCMGVGYDDARRLATRPRPSQGQEEASGRREVDSAREVVPAVQGVPVRPVI